MDDAWPAFIERGFDGYRAYYSYLPKSKLQVEYTMRLNNTGTFGLPPTRIEALYVPSSFGALPHALIGYREAEMKRLACFVIACVFNPAAIAAPSFDEVRA